MEDEAYRLCQIKTVEVAKKDNTYVAERISERDFNVTIKIYDTNNQIWSKICPEI